MSAPDLLEAIVAATRHAVAAEQERRPIGVVEGDAAGRHPLGAEFAQRLVSRDGIHIIAECKRRSPSRGVLRDSYDPVEIAAGYEAAGAAAVSVLTEPAFFDGALAHLERVRERVAVPVLRKDFIVTPYQVVQARGAGADAILLIVAALDDEHLHDLLALAMSLGLAALVEVHDRTELNRALEAGATVIGVNNRNLRTLEVDVEASLALVDEIPDDVVAVAESGLHTSGDVRSLRLAGYDAFLIGEALVTASDPGAALASLRRQTGRVPRGERRRARSRPSEADGA